MILATDVFFFNCSSSIALASYVFFCDQAKLIHFKQKYEFNQQINIDGLVGRYAISL